MTYLSLQETKQETKQEIQVAQQTLEDLTAPMTVKCSQVVPAAAKAKELIVAIPVDMNLEAEEVQEAQAAVERLRVQREQQVLLMKARAKREEEEAALEEDTAEQQQQQQQEQPKPKKKVGKKAAAADVDLSKIPKVKSGMDTLTLAKNIRRQKGSYICPACDVVIMDWPCTSTSILASTLPVLCVRSSTCPPTLTSSISSHMRKAVQARTCATSVTSPMQKPLLWYLISSLIFMVEHGYA